MFCEMAVSISEIWECDFLCGIFFCGKLCTLGYIGKLEKGKKKLTKINKRNFLNFDPISLYFCRFRVLLVIKKF